MNSRGGACSPADSDVDDILFGKARFYIFDARALNDFYFYSSFSSYLVERKWIYLMAKPWRCPTLWPKVGHTPRP